jgi:hypothetical protein
MDEYNLREGIGKKEIKVRKGKKDGRTGERSVF